MGARLTRVRLPAEFYEQLRALFELSLFHDTFWIRLFDLLRPLFVPFAVGSTIGALILAAVAYPLALGFVTSRRRIHDIIHHKHPPQ
jgi:hypothetical protein